MLTQEHTQTAMEFLDKADRHYADGYQVQASATLWEAAAHAVMAVASERGWPHANQSELRQAAGRLADEHNDPLISGGFALSEKYLHDSHHLFMEDYEWMADRPKVHNFVERVLTLRNSSG